MAPKSARASTGAVIRQSDPLLVNDSVRSGVAIETLSTFSRSNFRHRLVAQVEGRSIEARVQIRRDEKDAGLVRQPRVEVGAGRCLLTNQQMTLLAAGLERDVDAGRVETELLVVGRLLVDDPLDLEGGQVRGQAGELTVVGSRGHGCRDLPFAGLFLRPSCVRLFPT